MMMEVWTTMKKHGLWEYEDDDGSLDYYDDLKIHGIMYLVCVLYSRCRLCSMYV